MEIDNILILRTLILFFPYVILCLYFHYKIRDRFFLKPRTYVQLNLLMIILVIVFIETVYWHLSLRNFGFSGFYLNPLGTDASNTILVLLGVLAAVLGWLFAYRGQALTATRNHTMQTLMESRLSEVYTRQVETATEVYTSYKKTKGDSYCLEYSEFIQLKDKYKNSIFYLLNYLEFVSVGIRCGDLDEIQMKNMMKSIISANYNFFEDIIKQKQLVRPTVYEHLTCLYKRWNC